jgi:hypothetical protein
MSRQIEAKRVMNRVNGSARTALNAAIKMARAANAQLGRATRRPSRRDCHQPTPTSRVTKMRNEMPQGLSQNRTSKIKPKAKQIKNRYLDLVAFATRTPLIAEFELFIPNQPIKNYLEASSSDCTQNHHQDDQNSDACK